jgi:hypothetical protein
MVHGAAAGEAAGDGEGVQAAWMVGRTVAWLLKCIEAGRAAGATYPQISLGDRARTNFIR